MNERLRALLVRWRTSPYVANIAKLASGAVVAQAIGMFTAPILTRMYQPAVYGIAATYAAVVTLVASVAMFRFELSIVPADSDDEAAEGVGLSMGFVASVFTILSVLLLLYQYLPFVRAAASFSTLMQLGDVLVFFPLSVGTAAVVILLTNWANRKAEYALLSSIRALPPFILFGVASLFFLIFGARPVGLVAGQATVSCVTVLWLYLFLRRNKELPPSVRSTSASLRSFVAKYREFPLYTLPMTVLDQFTMSLPLLLFVDMYTPAYAAFFALANNILRLPGSLIGSSISTVFFKDASALKESPAQLHRFVTANIRMLFLLGSLPMILAVLPFGPWLFKLVFGAPWRDAGVFAQYLIFATAASLIGSPISTLPIVLQRQKIQVVFLLILVVGRVGGIWIGSIYHSPHLSILFFSLAEVLNVAGFIIWILFEIRRLIPKSTGTGTTA